MATSDGTVNIKERMKLFEGKIAKKQQQTKLGTPVPGGGRHQRRKDDSKIHDGALFKEPAQFIFTDEETGKLRYDEKTVQLLTEIKQPLNVVAITGVYRTGKSYLLNRLAGEKGGFKTGNKTHACTKGIWIWCRRHPFQDDQILVLLDVEGFGDLEKVNRKEDTWLFTLATILSSTLVYNNKGTLDAYALDRLKFLEEVDSTIQVSQDEEDKRLLDFDFFFPSFVVTLRDFELEIVSRTGKSITPDEFLEDVLVQKRGKGKDVETYNNIRLLIRRYFKKRKCYAFNTPCGPKQKLEMLADGDIEPGFLKCVEEFSDYVLKHQPLQLKSGREINGRMFANLAMHYVNAMSKNKQPSILEATKHMVDTENQATVSTASEIYKNEMQQYLAKMGDFVPKDEALVNYHEQCMTKALEVFQKLIVFDDDEIFHKQTMSACKILLSQFKGICDANSIAACHKALHGLNMRVEKKLKAGTYCCVSGYDEFIQDMNWIVRRYTKMTGLGSQSREILQGYLDGKQDEEDQVYQMSVTAQTGRSDMPNAVQERSSIKYKTSPSRPSSVCGSLKTKVEKMESDFSQVLIEQHTKDKKRIQENYIDNLKLKIEELHRQRSEQSQDMNALKEIESQIAYLNKVYEYAKNLNENEATTPDNDEIEEQPSRRDELGQRPATMGCSQENFEEEARPQPSKGKRRWCRMQ